MPFAALLSLLLASWAPAQPKDARLPLSAPRNAPPASAEPRPQLPKGFLPLPIVRQATSYSCGAAALLSVLYYWQAFDGREDELYARLETSPKDGTEPPKLAEAARAFGLEARLQEGATLDDLRRALARGETAILDIQAWRSEESKARPWSELWEDGHYVVLAGMDGRNAYFMDPSAGASYAWMPLDELLERWHDYEDRRGFVRRYERLALFIRGKTPLKTLPAPLIRLE